MLGPSLNPRPEYAFCGCGGPISIGMASDRDEIQSSSRSGGRLVLPDMPPGDPPLQDTALRFRQDCEQLLAKHSLLGVARGEYPPRALAVEENFPLELLPPLDPSTATAKDVAYRMQLEIRNRRNDQLRFAVHWEQLSKMVGRCCKRHGTRISVGLLIQELHSKTGSQSIGTSVCTIVLPITSTETAPSTGMHNRCSQTMAGRVAEHRMRADKAVALIEEIVDTIFCPTTGAFMCTVVTGYRVLMTTL